MVKFKELKVGMFKGIDYEAMEPIAKKIIEQINQILPSTSIARQLVSPALAIDARVVITHSSSEVRPQAKRVPPGNTMLLAHKFIVDSFIQYLYKMSKTYKSDFDKLIGRATTNMDDADLVTAELLSHFLDEFVKQVGEIPVGGTTIRIIDLPNFEGSDDWERGSQCEGAARARRAPAKDVCKDWEKELQEEEEKAKETGDRIAENDKKEGTMKKELQEIEEEVEWRHTIKSIAGKIAGSFRLSNEERKKVEELLGNNPELSKVVYILYQLLTGAHALQHVARRYGRPPPPGEEYTGIEFVDLETALSRFSDILPTELYKFLHKELFPIIVYEGGMWVYERRPRIEGNKVYVLVDKSGSTASTAKDLAALNGYTYLQIEKAIALLLLLAAEKAKANYCLRFFDDVTYPGPKNFPLCVNVGGRAGGQLQALLDYLKGVEPDGGTNIEGALKVALDDLINKGLLSGGEEARIVLLTDGEDVINVGNLLPLFKKAKAKLIAFSLSTENRGIKELAEKTGGVYIDHTFKDLKTLYNSLAKGFSKL